VRENEPESWKRVRYVMLPKGLRSIPSNRRERAIDVADASGTLMLDVASRKWSAEEVLEAVQINASLLPTVVRVSRYLRQNLCCWSRSLTGLAAGTPVVAGAGDQAAGGHRHGHRHALCRERDDWNVRRLFLPQPIVWPSIHAVACTRFVMRFPAAGT